MTPQELYMDVIEKIDFMENHKFGKYVLRTADGEKPIDLCREIGVSRARFYQKKKQCLDELNKHMCFESEIQCTNLLKRRMLLIALIAIMSDYCIRENIEKYFYYMDTKRAIERNKIRSKKRLSLRELRFRKIVAQFNEHAKTLKSSIEA